MLYPIAKELSENAYLTLKTKVNEVRKELKNVYNEDTVELMEDKSNEVDEIIN